MEDIAYAVYISQVFSGHDLDKPIQKYIFNPHQYIRDITHEQILNNRWEKYHIIFSA